MSEIKNQFSQEVRASYTSALDQFTAKKGAWKKEFEKQLYNNSQMKASDHSYQKKTARSSDDVAKTSKDFLSVFEVKQKNPVNDKRETVVSQSLLGNGSLSNKQSVVVENNSNNLFFNSGTHVISSFESKGMSKIVGAQTTQQHSLSNIDPLAINVNDKTLSIKVMPDGEIIVRHYLSPSYNKNELHWIVKNLQTILGKNIEKLRVNGDLVWESASQSQNKDNHTYKVNLIF